MSAEVAAAQANVAEHDTETLQNYLQVLIHSWSKTTAALGFVLVPVFYALDMVMMPADMLARFGIYRLVCTLIIFGQYLYLYYTAPQKYAFLHGYFFNLVVGGTIALMTTDLGGFDHPYYAGLNLVMIAVNLLLPWEMIHSAINCLLTISIYVLMNLALADNNYDPNILINNLYFMGGTGIISISINYVKQRLIKQEFLSRVELKYARDALWGEMEVAKHIQTALLPSAHYVRGYEIAASMIPADEVGGDYYDVIETKAGETWLSIGDVSGHGVESGLIMMMTQTSIFTTVNHTAGYKPSTVLTLVNSIIKENISRLGTDRYMTITTVRLDHNKIVFSGKHQDILVYRAKRKVAEYIPSKGTWIGLLDDIGDYLGDTKVTIEEGDVVILFTDGITEAANKDGEMFGEMRLQQALLSCASKPVSDIVTSIMEEVIEYMEEQRDDMTILAFRRISP